MEPRQRLDITQTQRLHLNTGLQAAIRVLRADAAGLTRYLEEQAAENPALRLEPVNPAPQDWLPRWSGLVVRGGVADIYRVADAAPGLMAHVTEAVDRLYPSGTGRRIALALSEALEPSGWLGTPPEAVAAQLGRPVAEVEAVMHRLQTIEPAGLFARDLRDCLRLQLVDQGLADPVMLVVIRHLDLLATGDLGRLAALADTTVDGIAARFRTIRSLNPKPGTEFGGMAAAGVREPDLVVRHDGTGWVMDLNRSALPAIRVDAGRGAGRAAARGVQRLVAARNNTLLRVGQEILRRQMAALEAGPVALEPMTMAEVAEALDLHESTVSRIVAGTSMDTPRGTWWLRALFSRRLGAGAAQSGAALRARLAGLVGAEDKTRPLSDQALAVALADGGATIARRTVTKYREALGIPPAHRRKQAPRLGRDRKGRVSG